MSENSEAQAPNQQRIATAPVGVALVLSVGPAIVWCAEYVGSGEVILATRVGAILGTGVIWAVIAIIFLKYLIGLAGGWYTVTTGESMMDLFGRLPVPGNAVVWFVLVAQLGASVFAIGSVASSAGAFLTELLPISPNVGGWAAALLAFSVAWIGEFKPLKLIMGLLVSITLLGIAVTAFKVFPSLGELLTSLTPHLPPVPEWAVEKQIATNAWSELLPLFGWGAGGFASQVWYTYWIMGAGYGAAAGKRQGKPADEEFLRSLKDEDADRLLQWRRVVNFDATTALIVGTAATLGFLIAGAGVLGAQQMAPKGNDVALTLANIFSENWGQTGATLFLMGGAAALVSTLLAQVTGWPYLLDDAVRICMPGLVSGWTPLARRRAWLVFFLVTSMIVVFAFGYEPVLLVQVSAIADGLLLTPIQALALIVGLYWVMPRMLPEGVGRRLKPGPWIGIGLTVTLVVFAYFCVARIPAELSKLLSP